MLLCGDGLYSDVPILSGSIVCEARGARINREEVLRRDNFENLVQASRDEYIDTSSDIFRFAQHSCDPNCKLVVSKSSERVFLVAIRSIGIGQWITWDYSTADTWGDCWFECDCGSLKCRKRIWDWADMKESQILDYLEAGMFPRFVLEEIVKGDVSFRSSEAMERVKKAG